MRIDFHSHILPEMDDGASGIGMSGDMLLSEREQGVELTLLTPHYYKSVESPETFLKRREESFEKLIGIYDKRTMPYVMLGAEVEMYRHMSEDDLSALCIGNTNLLLCEMPMRRAEYTVEELSELVCQGFVPLIAHFERYFPMYREKDIMEIVDVEGCIFQINVSSLESRRIKEKVFRLAQMGLEFALGTDAHNLTSRSPVIDRNFAEYKKSSAAFLDSVERTEESLLELIR